MNFVHLKWLPLLIIIAIAYLILIKRSQNNFFKWVKLHWFFSLSNKRIISNGLYYLSIILFLVSLLDLRGQEERVESKIPNQKTIILIDTSSSMLVEDIRPSRFSKAIFLARHLIRNAAGHQISLVVFANDVKQIVPFTIDTDLLDSKIQALENLDIKQGGSNLSLALMETSKFFQSSDDKKLSGNIVVFSDSEETEDGLELNISNSISLAFVGVGTVAGGPIPIRNKNGQFLGYKKFNGEDVISKLDENNIKKIGNKINNFNYWIARSYSLPTEEILTFFSKLHNDRFTTGEAVIRPVLMEYILVPAILFFIISCCLRMGKSFTLAIFFLFVLTDHKKVFADQEELELIKDNIRKGDGDKKAGLKLAELLLKNKEIDKAITLYQENISDNDILSKINLGTAHILKKDIEKGLEIYSQLREVLGNNQELIEIIQKNTLLALKQQQDQQQQENNENKDQKDDQQQQNQNQDQNKSNEQKEKSDQQEKQEKGQDQNKEKENKEKDKNEEQKDDKQKNDQEKESEEDKKEKEQQKKPMSTYEVPALLNQLIDEDKKLQEQNINKETMQIRDKTKNRELKDW